MQPKCCKYSQNVVSTPKMLRYRHCIQNAKRKPIQLMKYTYKKIVMIKTTLAKGCYEDNTRKMM